MYSFPTKTVRLLTLCLVLGGCESFDSLPSLFSKEPETKKVPEATQLVATGPEVAQLVDTEPEQPPESEQSTYTQLEFNVPCGATNLIEQILTESKEQSLITEATASNKEGMTGRFKTWLHKNNGEWSLTFAALSGLSCLISEGTEYKLSGAFLNDYLGNIESSPVYPDPKNPDELKKFVCGHVDKVFLFHNTWMESYKNAEGMDETLQEIFVEMHKEYMYNLYNKGTLFDCYNEPLPNE